jgi:hypothetical protein
MLSDKIDMVDFARKLIMPPTRNEPLNSFHTRLCKDICLLEDYINENEVPDQLLEIRDNLLKLAEFIEPLTFKK